MILQKKLLKAFQQAIKALYRQDLPSTAFILQPTNKVFKGSHTLMLFPLTVSIKQPFSLIGQALGNWLLTHTQLVADYEVKEGFLNLSLTDTIWISALQTHLASPWEKKPPQKIIIEIACPNTNKPLHLGHLRNSFIGDTIARVLQAVGHHVTKIIHINDRGIHICKSMYAYQQDKTAQTPNQAKIKGDHLVGDYYVKFDTIHRKEMKTFAEGSNSKRQANLQTPSMKAVQKMLQRWEAGDPEIMELWKKMNNWVYQGFQQTYQQLGIQFDKTYFESQTYLIGKKVVQEGLQKGLFYQESNGAIWVDLTEEGLGKKLLLRADGTAVYITQDLGTADKRAADFAADRSIYVVGDEQDYHFKVLFAILKKLDRPYANKLHHLSYGMVDLPTGKMKSREGTVVEADDLIATMQQIAYTQTKPLDKTKKFAKTIVKLCHTLAIGALKFFLLKVHPQKRMRFDPAQSINLQGHTGPFIQYTHARIATMLQKAAEHSINFIHIKQAAKLKSIERKLIAHLVQLKEIIQEVACKLNPSLLAQYAYTLAKLYNQFYAQCVVLQEKDKIVQKQRLYLSHCIMHTLQKVARLLGIELPKSM